MFYSGDTGDLPDSKSADKLTVLSSQAGESNTVAFDFFRGVPPDIFITQDSDKTRAVTQAAWFGSALLSAERS